MSRPCCLDNLGLLLSPTGQVSVRDNIDPKKRGDPETNTKHQRTQRRRKQRNTGQTPPGPKRVTFKKTRLMIVKTTIHD